MAVASLTTMIYHYCVKLQYAADNGGGEDDNDDEDDGAAVI